MSASPSDSWLLPYLIIFLFSVVLIFILYIYKNSNIQFGKYLPSNRKNNKLNILQTVRITPTTYLVVVEWNQEELLLSINSNGTQIISQKNQSKIKDGA